VEARKRAQQIKTLTGENPGSRPSWCPTNEPYFPTRRDRGAPLVLGLFPSGPCWQVLTSAFPARLVWIMAWAGYDLVHYGEELWIINAGGVSDRSPSRRAALSAARRDQCDRGAGRRRAGYPSAAP
jgi:hypothetical protein